MIKHTLSQTVRSDSGLTAITGSGIETGTGEIQVNQNFQAGSSGVATSPAVAIPHSTYQEISMMASANCAVLFAGPAVTINLVAGRLYHWGRSDGYFPNPFSSDVTGATVTSTPAAIVQILVLLQ